MEFAAPTYVRTRGIEVGMAGKLGAKAMAKLEVLEESRRKVERISSLIEYFVSARSGQDQYLMSIISTATQLQRVLMMHGLGTIADSANQVKMVSRRGGTPTTKARNLRELITSIDAALDRTAKSVRQAAVAPAAENE